MRYWHHFPKQATDAHARESQLVQSPWLGEHGLQGLISTGWHR